MSLRPTLLVSCGLALLVAGSSLLLLPLLPARPALGAMTHVPHAPWAAAAACLLGLVLLRSASK